MVAIIGPRVEWIRIPNIFHIGIQRIGTVERPDLPAVQRVSLSVASRLPRALAQADHRVGSVIAGLHAITTRLRHRECKIRSIHFKIVIFIQAAHPKIDRARRQLDLYSVVIQIQKRETGILAQPDGRRTKLQFSARVLIGPEFIPRRHRTIRNCPHPIIFTSRLN